MLDLAFAVQGRALPRSHRAALAAALQRALPWLGEPGGAAVHRLNGVTGGDAATLLLSGRTRLTLRLPRERVAEATAALDGATLQIGAGALRLGAAHARELLPFGTLYAHFVAAAGDDGAADAGDEAAFMAEVQRALAALEVDARVICGRRQRLDEGGAGSLGGYGLMLDGLDREDSRRVLERGIGPHRLWGCGVFVPHKSAAAVGMPD
ncbi:MAG: type I-MYXAN CRISPR-associated protein Cas6/Cmx6 [Rubrivivax sp.]|nr:type I-MYXAN CRISPR-associated protein Cas6/Cmx6 [Rubrivivax sp.]